MSTDAGETHMVIVSMATQASQFIRFIGFVAVAAEGSVLWWGRFIKQTLSKVQAHTVMAIFGTFVILCRTLS
jgi:hypothetical protein